MTTFPFIRDSLYPYTTLDDLNVAMREHSRPFEAKGWIFTGWKPGQGNNALMGQLLHVEVVDGKRKYTEQIQVEPLYPPYDLEEGLAHLEAAMAMGPAPENRPDLVLVIRRDDPDYDKYHALLYKVQK